MNFLEAFHLWPSAAKKCSFLGLNLLIIALVFSFLIQTQIEVYRVLQKKEAHLKTVFESKQLQLAAALSDKQQFEAMKADFARQLKQAQNKLGKALLTEGWKLSGAFLSFKTELLSVLEALSKIGFEFGLSFELLAPEPELKHDFYVTIPIKIILRGKYFGFASFVQRITELNLPLSFSALEMKRAPEGQADELLIYLDAQFDQVSIL